MNLAIALAISLAASEPPPSTLQPGQTRVIRTPSPGTVAPGLPDDRAFIDFYAAVRSAEPVQQLPSNIIPLADGTEVQIRNLRDRPIDPKKVPVVEVTIRGGPFDGRLAILPVAYIRPTDARPGPGEIPLPRLYAVPDRDYVATTGEQRTIDPAGRGVVAASDMFSYDELQKSHRAGDTQGLKDLAARKRITVLPAGTRVLIVKRHANMFIDEGTPVVETRILDGPARGDKAWITESEIAPPVIQIVRDKPVPRPNPRRSRARRPVQPPRPRR